MKVGDIVRQNGNLIQFDGPRQMPLESSTIGVVIKIENSRKLPEKYEKWNSWLGRSVTVLWSSNKIMKIAENSLEVINEKR
tara:strand:- start:3480 stop:3722 length:243 start_codon:yes stop_codon:yes gene_type:complete